MLQTNSRRGTGVWLQRLDRITYPCIHECAKHALHMCFTCALHVLYMCFTCALHVLYMCFTCALHMLYMCHTLIDMCHTHTLHGNYGCIYMYMTFAIPYHCRYEELFRFQILLHTYFQSFNPDWPSPDLEPYKYISSVETALILHISTLTLSTRCFNLTTQYVNLYRSMAYII